MYEYTSSIVQLLSSEINTLQKRLQNPKTYPKMTDLKLPITFYKCRDTPRGVSHNLRLVTNLTHMNTILK